MERQIFIHLLEKSELSQKEFAAKIGFAESRVSEWLRGVRNPKMSNLRKMAEILGFEIITSFEVRKL